MKILLIGEFSNLHWTLAEGLRAIGYEVCVVSDGDGWKNYPRNINLQRSSDGIAGGISYILKLIRLLPQLKGFDVVQIISPCFLSLRPEKSLYIYHYLRKHNKKIFLGAFGVDHYYGKTCMETDTFRYSDFKIGNSFKDTPANREIINELLHGGTAKANQIIAKTCNGIIACLYEYYVSYTNFFPEKTKFIPLPINNNKIKPQIRQATDKIKFFIGIQAQRSDIKGTDIMYPVLQEIGRKYPDQTSIITAISVPYDKYEKMIDDADVQLDQLYSYAPSMNSLLAMAKGVVVVGGGEEENYNIIEEKTLRPIINVTPDPNDIYLKLEQLVRNKDRIPALSKESIEYVYKHHDYIKIARQYADFWKKQ